MTKNEKEIMNKLDNLSKRTEYLGKVFVLFLASKSLKDFKKQVEKLSIDILG